MSANQALFAIATMARVLGVSSDLFALQDEITSRMSLVLTFLGDAIYIRHVMSSKRHTWRP
jgi:hypothetical protein